MHHKYTYLSFKKKKNPTQYIEPWFSGSYWQRQGLSWVAANLETSHAFFSTMLPSSRPKLTGARVTASCSVQGLLSHQDHNLCEPLLPLRAQKQLQLLRSSYCSHYKGLHEVLVGLQAWWLFHVHFSSILWVPVSVWRCSSVQLL